MDKQEEQESVVEEIPQTMLAGKYISIERRSPRDTVFLVDDVTFRSAMPHPTHWSIAWSDLMMTMFVLFLSMFVYKAANQDFLVEQGLEVIGGDTTEALQTDMFAHNGLPFAPISPALPLMTGGTIKKTESISLQDLEVKPTFPESSRAPETRIEITKPPADTIITREPDETQIAVILESPGEEVPVPTLGQELVEPRPLVLAPPLQQDRMQEIFRLSKEALESNNLRKFATIDLVPDNTMRIILTGDLLFETGRADLTEESRVSLEQLATGIQTTPYMINVVGHTDNIPMTSGRYESNWELSVARASTVARFLIEGMGMNPNQFVVSGYSSYRPLVANSDALSRAKNRRVEIIISKRLPKPVPADAKILNQE